MARVDDLGEDTGLVVEVEGSRVAIFRDGEGVAAVSDRCPHAGGSLGAGWVEAGEVVCPLHHWRFRLADGRCADVRGYGVERWACEVRAGSIWVKVRSGP